MIQNYALFCINSEYYSDDVNKKPPPTQHEIKNLKNWTTDGTILKWQYDGWEIKKKFKDERLRQTSRKEDN